MGNPLSMTFQRLFVKPATFRTDTARPMLLDHKSTLSRHMQRHGGSCVFTTIDTEGKGLFPDEATKAPDYVTGS